jgi:3-oxoacyl-(acyl-carrier-protein) synthase
MSPRDEVWITGVGLASPLGCDLAQFTDSLLQGRCGIRRVSKMPAARTSQPDRRRVDRNTSTGSDPLEEVANSRTAGATGSVVCGAGSPASRFVASA